MNELAVRIETPDEWDIFTLRNVVRSMNQTELALVGYLTGHAYSIEMVRVECDEPRIDIVYGIDIPTLANRPREVDFPTALAQLKKLCIGATGSYVRRCMGDLVLAMQHTEDTAFFCYRAIEALKNHATRSHPGPPGNESDQWKRFRSTADCTRDEIDFIKNEADPLRHSSDLLRESKDLDAILTQTWKIVEGYITHLSKVPPTE
jgi:hypothetical protein